MCMPMGRERDNSNSCTSSESGMSSPDLLNSMSMVDDMTLREEMADLIPSRVLLGHIFYL